MKKKYLNISLVQYVNLSDNDRDEYDVALLYSKQATEPIDHLKLGDFTQLKFGQVKDMQQTFSGQPTLYDYLFYMAEIAGKTNQQIADMSVFDFFAQKSYIDSEIKRIGKVEKELLSHASSEDEQAAGLDRFTKFGVIIQIDNLAGGDVLRWDAIRELKYETGLVKLSLDATVSQYRKDYNDIVAKRMKRTKK